MKSSLYGWLSFKLLRTDYMFQRGAKFRREAAMGHEISIIERTCSLGNFVPVRTPKPVTSATACSETYAQKVATNGMGQLNAHPPNRRPTAPTAVTQAPRDLASGRALSEKISPCAADHGL
jgi:hypothetical protein